MNTAPRKGVENWRTILRFSNKEVSQSKLARAYRDYRQEQGMPDRCDNPSCCFHTAPLRWNNEDLPFILDHMEGNRLDNSPNRLRYLCPNCDAQLPTRGGKNRGRVTILPDGFIIVDKKARTMIFAGTLRASGSSTANFVGASDPNPSSGT